MARMEFGEIVRRRRMVRRYSDRPLDGLVIERLLQNAVRAPSAGFSQGWAFLVLERAPDIARFWAAATPPERSATPDAWLTGMRTAPLVIVPMSSREVYLRRYAESDKAWTPGNDDPWSVPYWHIDTGMACLLILQTAVDEGLGACFFGIPASRTDALRREFGVPEEYMPVGAITVGHPGAAAGAGSAGSRPRRTVAEVVHRGQWRG